jgi:hypothetical protein
LAAGVFTGAIASSKREWFFEDIQRIGFWNRAKILQNAGGSRPILDMTGDAGQIVQEERIEKQSLRLSLRPDQIVVAQHKGRALNQVIWNLARLDQPSISPVHRWDVEWNGFPVGIDPVHDRI